MAKYQDLSKTFAESVQLQTNTSVSVMHSPMSFFHGWQRILSGRKTR